MGDSVNRPSGIGTLTVLTLIFVVLKLTGNIDWSWWWVLSPTIIDVSLASLVILLFFADKALNP